MPLISVRGRRMSPAANTRDCFSEFIGQRVVGVLFDALPAHRHDIARGTKTLIFEDGRGLTMSSTGAYWIERAEDVRASIFATERRLAATKREIDGVLELAKRASA